MKNKKAAIAIASLVKAIIMLTVVGGASYGTYQILLGDDSNLVRYMLGLGNISEFDQSIVERYNTTKDMNIDAIHSTIGLLYGVNRLVESDQGMLQKSWSDINRSFGNTKVIPTLSNLRPLYLGASNRDPSEQMAKAIVDCWTIFYDEAKENKYCFIVEPTAMEKGQTVTKESLAAGFEKLKQQGYHKKKIEDLQGTGFWNNVGRIASNSYRGIGFVFTLGYVELKGLNIENIAWDSDIEITKDLKKKVIVCSDNDDINEVHITTVGSGHCTPSEAEVASSIRQIYIEDFSLPQHITKSPSILIYTIEEWLNAYGDPEYILFYEKFPEDEAKYWHVAGYKIAWVGIVTAGAISLGIDLLTLGMGTLLAPIGRRLMGTFVGKAFKAIKSAVADAISFIGRKTVGGLLSRIFKESAEAAVKRQLLKEAAEETTEKFIAQATKELIGEAPEAVVKGMKESAEKASREILEELATNPKLVSRAGRLTKEGQEEFLEKMSKAVFTEDNLAYREIITKRANQLYDAVGRQGPFTTHFNAARKEVQEAVAQKASKELGEAVARENAEAVSKTLIKMHKIKTRTENILGKSLSPDLTERQAKSAIKKMMEEASAGLNALKPAELRHVAREVSELTPRMITPSGDVVLGEVFEAGADRASQTAAKKIMATRLDDIILVEGEALWGAAYKYAAPFERFAQRSIRVASSQIKTRNLIIGAATYYAMKLESMSEKAKPIGTNAIGLKTPLESTVVYDDSPLKFVTKDTFMEEFGKQEKNIGLLPEAEKYYLSLTRDKHAYWFDQPPIRFHLVSPCFADIMMRVTRCECGYRPDPEEGLYETGIAYTQLKEQFPDIHTTGAVAHFDGTNPMLYKVDDLGRPIKECIPKGFFQFDNTYKPKCLEINPVLSEDYQTKGYDYNYCYHGKNPANEVLSGLVTTFEIGLPFLCLGLGFAPPVAIGCMVGAGFATAIGGEYVKQELGISQQWPNRG
ncbi:hypothetical protein KY331_02000 [Candidatus Woesearchaeota archaeon]|nr:hypothetical protein [Candidatus Woesearchaeota archaeon]